MQRRGLTIIEVLLTVSAFAILVLVGGSIVIAGVARQDDRLLKDAVQVRGIHQAMIMWAQNNDDEYPLPSRFDLDDATVAEEGAAKDTTANIMSILIGNGFIGPELLVSPGEVNPSITIYEDYQHDNPRRAVRPKDAFWDPGLRADFTSPDGGHISYAHLIPHGNRLAKWRNTFVRTEAIIGLRGPEITSATSRDGAVEPQLANPESNTIRILGSRQRWNGNVAFNDNHVLFLTELHKGTYTNRAGENVPDLLHYDEPDDVTGLNTYLGIFIKAGDERRDFRAIWD